MFGEGGCGGTAPPRPEEEEEGEGGGGGGGEGVTVISEGNKYLYLTHKILKYYVKNYFKYFRFK